MPHRVVFAFASGLLLSNPVLAQTAPAIPNPPPAASTQGLPAGQAPGTPGTPQMGVLAEADARFVAEASAAGVAEVELGKLASSKAASPEVKQFGEMMVNDHTKANAQLQALVQNHKTPSMTPQHQRTHDRLAGLSGQRFDRRYVTIQVREHEKAVQLFKRQAASGQDPQLKRFAAENLPTLQQHLQMAQTLSASMSPPAQSRLNNATPATGRSVRASAREEAYTADQLNEAEYQRIRSGSTGTGAMAATASPRALGPCAPGKSAESAARAATASGSQPDTTKSPDANVAEQRLRAAGYC